MVKCDYLYFSVTLHSSEKNYMAKIKDFVAVWKNGTLVLEPKTKRKSKKHDVLTEEKVLNICSKAEKSTSS